jgi:hypothetical protein
MAQAIDRLYRRFWRAAKRQDGETVTRLIREHPGLHDYVGEAGDLVGILDRDAPTLLEAAFQAGLSPDAGQEGTPQTFLQSAAANGDLEKVRLALRYGADPEKRNDAGEIALGYACSWGQFEAVKLLVESGVNVNAIEENPEAPGPNTALDCVYRSPEIMEYLRAHGAKHYRELVGEAPEAGEAQRDPAGA